MGLTLHLAALGGEPRRCGIGKQLRQMPYALQLVSNSNVLPSPSTYLLSSLNKSVP